MGCLPRAVGKSERFVTRYANAKRVLVISGDDVT
nr:MAG TPA_asm: hypothetical protein [Caudoviricetes sp.]